MGKHKKQNSSDMDGQGGHVGQLRKLESTQMKTHQQAKKNPAQDALKSQSVNVMAPEVKRPRPRPRPVKPKSKTHPSTSEQRDLSPVDDLPSLHLRSPHSQFGFVPPDGTADEDDLEAGHAHDEGLGVRSSSADDEDDGNVPFPSRDDSDMCAPPQVSDDSGMKKQRHACPIPLSVDVDDIHSPPRSSNTSQMQKPTCTIFSDVDIQPSPQVPNRSYLKNFKKHARPITPSVDDNSIQRRHPIFSSSESTDSDISSPPRRNPKPASNSIALDTIHDVLQEHRAKNRSHHPPNPRTLQKLREQAVEEPSDDEEDKEPQAVQPCKRLRPPNKVYQTVGFYPHSWKDVLEAAKKKSCLGLVMNGATSTREAFVNKTGIEYLTETLEDFAADNIGVDAGFWDEHKHDMAIILWDDRATMRSEMKKIARPIAAAKYDILPADIYDDNECEEHVCSRVQDLLDGGNFLHNGVDEQERTNNLANDALGEFCSTFFYRSEHALAKSFPDEFAEAVPEGAVTLGATALAAAIDEYKTGVYKPTKFVSELYQPMYDSVMQLYEAIKLDPYHSKKCRAVHKKWACAAGALTRNQSNRRHNWGLKLKLD
ncbi:hypothetical protein F4604DRAFT_2039935 [Suillus subluteus]|nr:hypothetical protein F4604DRAFT_2039935 [Suillus subluteus]